MVPVAFAAFTGHAWEDYYITLRASRNLAEGNGLVFTPGERLHTFTSPLGTLLPAFFTWLTGPGREEAALWLFRLLNAGLLAAAAGRLWQRFDTLALGALGRVVFFGLMLADPKLIDFSINGMETAILVFFAVLLWTELEAPRAPRSAVLAVAFAGLMWTRPDAFVLAGALVMPHLIVRAKIGGPAFPWRAIGTGALLGGLLYVPWFAWAWWYYGTPVPHTVTAKATGIAFEPLQFALLPLRMLIGKAFGGGLYLPAYAQFGGWPAVVWGFARLLTLGALVAWLVPGLSPVARRASLTVFCGALYLSTITLFPWYVPPWTVIASLVLAFAADGWLARGLAPGWQRAVRSGALLIVIMQMILLLCVAWQMRAQQRHVETGVRRSIGEWLRDNAAPDDTVFMEPLGYIGYFSRLKTYDYPGLSSRDVVAAIRDGATTYPEIIARFRPRWLVLRPFELILPEFAKHPALDDYDLISVRSAQEQLNAIPLLPGRRWMEYEAQYYVFRRAAPGIPGKAKAALVRAGLMINTESAAP